MIAALYVQSDGVYAGLPDVELWPEDRDARIYNGPWAVVAHPPCQRWGQYWHGSPLKPHVFTKGDDGGCFAAALAAVRRFGGVLEHPEYSHAWFTHRLPWPPAEGWQRDIDDGWCCRIEQGFYGHVVRKPTWLYAVRIDPPSLRWGKGVTKLDPRLVAHHGYEKIRRWGAVSSLGGGGNSKKREATPVEFRNVLLSIAVSANANNS